MSKFRAVWRRARTKLKSIYYISLNIRDLKENRTSLSENTLKALYTRKPSEPGLGSEIPILPRFIIHPSNKGKLIWNGIIALLLLYTAIFMPYTLTFLEYTNSDPWGVIEIMLNIFFFLDIIVNFNSAYINHEGILVSDRSKIMLGYLKTWFLLDLAACFPFNAVGADNNSSSSGGYNNILRLLRLPRLYRIFRVVRLIKMFKHYKNSEIIQKLEDFLSIKHSIMKLFTSVFSIILCTHLMACFWYYSSKLEGFSPDTWVARSGIDFNDVPKLYLASLYWTMTTLCTVGYGDIRASTDLEKLLSIFWMIFSVYFLSFVIGSLSLMFSNIDTRENTLLNKLAVIDEFSKEVKLSKALRSKLRYALRYSTEQTGFTWADKQNIFNELPKQLRFEVAMAMHHGAARNIKFFFKKDQVVIAAIVPFLKPVFINLDEFVYKKKEYAEEVYFIVRGRISYVFSIDDIQLTVMQRGSYFGDIEVVLQVSRKYSAKALRDSELLIMNKELLAVIFEEYPKVWEEIKNSAIERNTTYDKALVQLKVLESINRHGLLEKFDVLSFKKSVHKKAELRKEKNKITNGAGME